MRQRAVWLCLLVLFMLATPLVAQTATPVLSYALYMGPGTTYAFASGRLVPADGGYTVVARNALGNWVQVEGQGISGWLPTGQLMQDGTTLQLADIPVSELPDADMARVPADAGDDYRLLHQTPILPLLESNRLAAIYADGLAQGNHPMGVARVGDCNTASELFLMPLHAGQVTLGPYAHLQATADALAPGLEQPSLAAYNGLNAISVFDPLWADPNQCEPNESPFACELRVTQPGVAIIMFGQNDLLALNSDQYRAQLTRMTEEALAAGVIPVLSTFTNTPDNAEHWFQVLRLNAITVEVAAEQRVPLLNFWLAARALPGFGIGDDYAHLTAGGDAMNFTGREAQYGLTLYNLAVLTLLDNLYAAVGNPAIEERT